MKINGAVGVVDPVALGWRGQRVWLHDGREVDDHSGRYTDMDLLAMRRSSAERAMSHGQAMTGRLRHAIAWALGLLDVADAYDAPDPVAGEWAYSRRKGELVPRQIFARLAGCPAASGERNPERWLLLDEPETGLDPEVLATLLATLVEAAGPGRLRVFCASHSPLVLDLASHASVQVVDLDGYAHRLHKATQMLADPVLRADVAAREYRMLRLQVAAGVAQGDANRPAMSLAESQSLPSTGAGAGPGPGGDSDDVLGNVEADIDFPVVHKQGM